MLNHYEHRQNRPSDRHLRSTTRRSGTRLLGMVILVFTLAGWDSGEIVDGKDPATWFGRVQVIHNAPDAGEIDLYVDGRRIWNDAGFQTATPYVPWAHGRHTIEIVAGADPNNSHPIFSQTITVLKGVNYVVVAVGLVNPSPGEPAFQLVVQERVRLETTSVADVDFFLVHGATCLGQVDMRTLDPVRNLRSTTRRSGTRLLGMVILVFTLAGWDSGEIVDGKDPATWFGRVQVIHNAPDAGEIDLYVDGRRIWNDAGFQTATPYVPWAHGRHTIEIVAGADPNNSHPIFSQTITVLKGVNYVVVAVGLVNPSPGEPAFQLVVQERVRLETTSVADVDFFLVHGATCLGQVDMRTLDPVRNNEVIGLLVNNIGFGEASAYVSLEAGAGHNIEIVTSDGETQLGVFRLASPAPSGETFIVTLSCLDANNVEGVTMMGVEIDGRVFLPPVITANERALSAALPETFERYGNFPNPFNPTTTIQFDLMQTAEISVEIVDMLGRRVMTVPAKQMEAGAARTVEVEAVNTGGETFIVTLSCLDANNVEGVTMMGVEIDGRVFLPPVITANERALSAALPETFERYGNFPNPFNPTTTIQFDLMQTAEISVEIVDMLGRRVMTVPAKQMEAGAARTVEVEAVNLASGAYLYHLIARTATETRVKTGWMMLIK